MIHTLLLIILILLLIGALPTWPHSSRWGYYQSGGLGLVLVILIILILLGFLYNVLHIHANAGDVARGLIPRFDGSDSVLLAVGILGATVMPHVIYLHSALTQDRIRPKDAGEKRTLLRFQRIDVTVAMGLAGLANMTMLVIAAAVFHGSGLTGVDTIEGAHAHFRSQLGTGAALAFALALLASGFASSSVGTYAGQVVMIPALVVLGIGLDPTRSLVISQVVLSFGIPFALIPLVMLTKRRDVMGELVNRRVTTVVAIGVAGLIVALNFFLLGQTLLG